MDDSAFAPPLASRGTRGGFGAKWEAETDGEDSLFTESAARSAKRERCVESGAKSYLLILVMECNRLRE